jgi:hypothetical protein
LNTEADALDDARRQGLPVVPLCLLIAHSLQPHPEDEDLVAAGYRDGRLRSRRAVGTRWRIIPL